MSIKNYEMKLTPEEVKEALDTEEERQADREEERWRKREMEFEMVSEYTDKEDREHFSRLATENDRLRSVNAELNRHLLAATGKVGEQAATIARLKTLLGECRPFVSCYGAPGCNVNLLTRIDVEIGGSDGTS